MDSSIEIITSPQNPKIKNLIKLHESKHRRNEGLFLIEGKRQIELALKSDIEIIEVIVSEDLLTTHHLPLTSYHLPSTLPITTVSEPIMKKLSFRENPDGILLLAKAKSWELSDLKNHSLLLLLEGLEKPGNLGAILRTADAAGVDGVICCDGTTDIYNPQVIQNSQGAIFTQKIAICDSKSAQKWLKENKIQTIASSPDAKELYTKIDIGDPPSPDRLLRTGGGKSSKAILMGSEDKGLTDFWLDHADYQVKIPMSGQADSLNLASATAILLYHFQ